MATEEGIVTKTGTNTAWVTTTKTDACKGCAAKSSCNAMGGGKEMKVEAINIAGAKIGDRIILSFETSSLLKAAFLLYVFPILCLLTGAFIGQQFALTFSYDESVVSAVAGFLFFFIAIFFIKLKGNMMAKRDKYRPKIIRIKKQEIK